AVPPRAGCAARTLDATARGRTTGHDTASAARPDRLGRGGGFRRRVAAGDAAVLRHAAARRGQRRAGRRCGVQPSARAAAAAPDGRGVHRPAHGEAVVRRQAGFLAAGGGPRRRGLPAGGRPAGRAGGSQRRGAGIPPPAAYHQRVRMARRHRGCQRSPARIAAARLYRAALDRRRHALCRGLRRRPCRAARIRTGPARRQRHQRCPLTDPIPTERTTAMKNRYMSFMTASALAASMLLALPAFAALNQGAKAPDFTAEASLAGKDFSFSLQNALKKGPVVVYFYPAAYTGGCDIEAHTFATQKASFDKAGATIIGVSADSIQPRTTFVIGRDGKIIAAFSSEADHLHPQDHVTKSLAIVQHLQAGAAP